MCSALHFCLQLSLLWKSTFNRHFPLYLNCCLSFSWMWPLLLTYTNDFWPTIQPVGWEAQKLLLYFFSAIRTIKSVTKNLLNGVKLTHFPQCRWLRVPALVGMWLMLQRCSSWAESLLLLSRATALIWPDVRLWDLWELFPDVETKNTLVVCVLQYCSAVRSCVQASKQSNCRDLFMWDS